MRKFLAFLCLLLSTSLVLSSCLTQDNNSEVTSETQSESSFDITSNVESETSREEEIKTMLTNLTFNNKGTRKDGFLMGDIDGPAYCVYSKIGYNKASFEVDLSRIKMDLTRKSDGKHINAYMFLGADIYDETASYWKNCIDAGLVKSGSGGGWHIFHSLYSVDSSFTGNKWYESKVSLSDSHKYRIELDASKNDAEATLTVFDLTDGGKVVDSVTFQLQFALKNGKNIRIYQDYALDYPPNTKFDTSGNASENWEDITLYNTNQGMYMKGVRIENVRIYDPEGEYIWGEEQTQERGMWPDASNAKLDYELVKIKNPIFDSYIWLDFDMNR